MIITKYMLIHKNLAFFVNQLKYPFSTPCQSLEERCIPLSQHAHQNISLTKTSKQ